MVDNGFQVAEFWPGQGEALQEEIILAYIAILINSDVQASTIKSKLSALKWSCDMQRIGSDAFGSIAVTRLKEGVKRQRPNRGRKSAPITVAVLQDLKRWADTNRQDQNARRLFLIMLLAFATFARPIEVIQWRAANIRFTEEGIEWTSKTRKTDRYREGQITFIAEIRGSELCPKNNLLAWICDQEWPSEVNMNRPFFPGAGEPRMEGPAAVSEKTIAKHLQLYLGKIGYRGRRITPHGGRAGGASAAHQGGASLEDIMAQGHWAGKESAMGYCERSRIQRYEISRNLGL